MKTIHLILVCYIIVAISIIFLEKTYLRNDRNNRYNSIIYYNDINSCKTFTHIKK